MHKNLKPEKKTKFRFIFKACLAPACQKQVCIPPGSLNGNLESLLSPSNCIIKKLQVAGQPAGPAKTDLELAWPDRPALQNNRQRNVTEACASPSSSKEPSTQTHQISDAPP